MNVYVFGTVDGTNGQPDYLTSKYDPEGRQIWSAQFNGTGNGRDVPAGLLLDAAENLIVTGTSWTRPPFGAAMDFTTIKYRQFEVGGAPKITLQPVANAADVGSTVTFASLAVGEEPLHYQWRFNTRDLPGATNSTLTLSNVNSSHGGEYSIQVSNRVGRTRSTEARLQVDWNPPTISVQIERVAPNSVNITADVPWQINFETSTDLLQWHSLNRTGSNTLQVLSPTGVHRFFRARLNGPP